MGTVNSSKHQQLSTTMRYVREGKKSSRDNANYEIVSPTEKEYQNASVEK
jgi:hypothetical protein